MRGQVELGEVYLDPFHSYLMSNLKLYYFPVSQPSRSVLLLLKEAGLEYEGTVINLMKGEQKQAEFLAINSMGLVPTIVDDGFTLSESGAILSYIAESRALTSWFPTDLKVRARVNYWLHWNHSATRLSTLKLLRPKFSGKEATEEDVKKFAEIVAVLDAQLDKNIKENEHNRFIAGTSEPTIADLLLVPELDQLTEDAFSLFDYTPYPHVVQYMKDVRGAVKSYDEVHLPMKAVADSLKKSY